MYWTLYTLPAPPGDGSVNEIVAPIAVFVLLAGVYEPLTPGAANNAYFLSYRRYQSKQDDFWREWRDEFSGNLRTYIAALAKRYP